MSTNYFHKFIFLLFMCFQIWDYQFILHNLQLFLYFFNSFIEVVFRTFNLPFFHFWLRLPRLKFKVRVLHSVIYIDLTNLVTHHIIIIYIKVGSNFVQWCIFKVKFPFLIIEFVFHFCFNFGYFRNTQHILYVIQN